MRHLLMGELEVGLLCDWNDHNLKMYRVIVLELSTDKRRALVKSAFTEPGGPHINPRWLPFPHFPLWASVDDLYVQDPQDLNPDRPLFY